jgi:integrase
MARPLELKPQKVAGKWRVNVAAHLSPTGKRSQRFFDNLGHAKGFIESLKTTRDNLAVLPPLSPAQHIDAVEALKELNEKYPGITLKSAVRGYLEVELQRGRSITLCELFDRFRRAKETKSLPYQRDLKWAFDKMHPFLSLMASDITHVHVAQAVAGMPASSTNNILRSLRAVFRYGLDMGWVASVPIRRGDFTHIPRKEVEVLPPAKIRRLLEAALIHIPEILPLLLVETFAGIRPEETARLAWSDIDLVKAKVTVRAAISKTSSGRSIRLADCALAWFRCCAIGTGAIAPWSPQILRSRMRKVRYHAGYRGAGASHWRPGALRDAFCSCHCAYYGDVSRLTLEAGHSSLQVTKDHYLGLVTPETAAEFWNLFPPGHKANVVQFVTG